MGDELARLCAQCDLLLFASLSEGIGLPPLEAMDCGAPVLAGAVTSMPAVLGDVGFLVEPTEEERIFDAARRNVSEPEPEVPGVRRTLGGAQAPRSRPPRPRARQCGRDGPGRHNELRFRLLP